MQVKVDQEVLDILNNVPPDYEGLAELKESHFYGTYGIVLTDKNELFQTFKYSENGKIFMLPEPNPIVIYFDSARHHANQLKGKRVDLFKELKLLDQNVGATTGDFY